MNDLNRKSQRRNGQNIVSHLYCTVCKRDFWTNDIRIIERFIAGHKKCEACLERRVKR